MYVFFGHETIMFLIITHLYTRQQRIENISLAIHIKVIRSPKTLVIQIVILHVILELKWFPEKS